MARDHTTSFDERLFHRNAAGLLAVFLTALSCGRVSANSNTSQSFPTEALWTVEISARPVGNPVATGDRLFLPLQSGVSARRLSDGKEIWTIKVDVDGPMAASKDRLFVPSKGELRGFDAVSGGVAWADRPGPIVAPPLVHDDILLVASGENLTAYQVADGTKLWMREIGVIDQRPAAQGPRVYVPVTDGRLVALDIFSGRTIWEHLVGIKPGEPLPFGDRIFVGSAKKNFCSLRIQDGVEEWCYLVGAAVIGAPAADASHVYFVALDHLLRAHDRRNGAQRWKADLNYRPSAGPSLVGASVSAPGVSSRLQSFDTRTGKPNAQLTLKQDLAAIPLFIPTQQSADDLGGTRLAALSGGLDNRWMLTLAVPPPPVPTSQPVVPLKVLPGQAIPVGTPPVPPGPPPPGDGSLRRFAPV